MPIDTLTQTVLFAAQEAEGGNVLLSFLPLILLVGVFWFLLMRPQQKRMREHRELMSEVKQGDKVVAAGGLVGTVRRVDDDVISLQVADNVVVKVDKSSVTRKID